MKVTFIAPTFPLKSISPYCFYLTQALSHLLKLECIHFSRTTFDFLYDGGSKDTTLTIPDLDVDQSSVKINFYNPLSWIKAGTRASGDIVHLQHWKTASSLMYCILVPILKIRGKKIIFSVHNITPHAPTQYIVLFDYLLNQFLFRFADCFIVHNQRNKEKLESLFPIEKKPIYVIGVGLHPPLVQNNLSKKKAREKLNIPKEKKVLLHFGYIWEYKGIGVLLNALERVSKNVPDVLLVIAGASSTNWKKYEDIIQQKHLTGFVQKHLHYIPESDVDIYFSAADLVVLPYIPPFDTHGGVGALTVALHKPLLVSDIGGLPEYTLNKQAIVQPGNIQQLTHSITLLLKDKKLLTSFAKDSRSIAKNLTWDEIAQKTMTMYEDMMTKI